MHAEIVLPETKPETEWVRGRALQKVSPTFPHARAQLRIGAALEAWAVRRDCGRVGTEWRFRLTPPDESTRPLVPDVGYASYADLPRDAADDAVAVPLLAPTVAVEILSPDDRRADVEDKVATYLACGSRAVIVVDPDRASAVVHDASGSREIDTGGTLEHASLPEFSFALASLRTI